MIHSHPDALVHRRSHLSKQNWSAPARGTPGLADASAGCPGPAKLSGETEDMGVGQNQAIRGPQVLVHVSISKDSRHVGFAYMGWNLNGPVGGHHFR